MWLDNVFIPWERVFLVEPSPEPIATWLLWHHLYGWLAKAEFTLGLALALTDAMGLKEHEQTVEYLVDLVAEVQTARACLTAAERDPHFTVGGNCARQLHASAAGRHRDHEGAAAHQPKSCASFRARRWSWRRPTATSPTRHGGGSRRDASAAAAIPRSSAPRCCSWRADHVSSALDGRELAFELHASGGIPAWRGRLAPALPELQRAGQRRAARDRPADARNRCRQHPGRAARAAPRHHPTARQTLMRLDRHLASFEAPLRGAPEDDGFPRLRPTFVILRSGRRPRLEGCIDVLQR